MAHQPFTEPSGSSGPSQPYREAASQPWASQIPLIQARLNVNPPPDEAMEVRVFQTSRVCSPLSVVECKALIALVQLREVQKAKGTLELNRVPWLQKPDVCPN